MANLAVSILHPAAMTLVPPRGRQPRMVHVAARVEGELPEVPRDAASPWNDGRLDRIRQGVLRVGGRDGAWAPVTWIGGATVTPDAFRDVLAGGDPDGLDLRGTPLCAWGNLADAVPIKPVTGSTRGDPMDLDAVRAVYRDGRAQAAAAARAFVSDNYVACGDAVLGRLSAVAAGFPRDRFDPKVGLPHERTPLWTPRHVLACPADYRAVLAYAKSVIDPGPLEPWLAAGEGWDPLAGARAALCSLPGHVRRMLLAAANGFDRKAGHAGRAEAAREEARALEPLEVEGMTGTCGAQDPAEAMRILARASIAARDAVVDGLDVHHPLFPAALWVSRVVPELYVPMMPVPAIDEADTDALAALGARP